MDGPVLRWRVPPAHALLKGLGAALLMVTAIARSDDRGLLLLAGVAALGCAALAARDMLAPVRLAADAEGVTVVTGFASRHRIPWTGVEGLRVDVRQRFGRRSALLEIETGAGLHQFSRFDLGVPPEDALEELKRLKT